MTGAHRRPGAGAASAHPAAGLRFVFFAAGVVAALVPAAARAQTCCSPATTPSAAIEHGTLLPGKLQVGVYAEYFLLSGGRRGTEGFEFPGDRRSNAHVVTVAGRAGVTDRFTVAALVPFNRRERSDRTITGRRERRSHEGIGDVAALGYYRFLSRLSRRELTVGAGLKLATGESRAEDATGELPEEVQPGTGANDVVLTAQYAQGFGRFSATGGATWRLTGVQTKLDEFPDAGGGIREVRRKFAFGNELLYGAAFAWSPDDRWGFEIGLRGRHAQPNRQTTLNPDGTTSSFDEQPSTGSNRIWLTPSIRLAPVTSRTAVSFGVMIPVYEYVRGSQLSTQPGFRFSVEGSP